MIARAAIGILLAALVAGIAYDLAVRRRPAVDRSFVSTPERIRQMLFSEIQPVRLKNCDLQRFGEKNDGGYLLCGNLLGSVQSGYSYGISGYDGWGCDISRGLGVPVHQYDCFDTQQPVCSGGQTVFHAECLGPERKVEKGRAFDTLQRQIEQNGDRTKRLVVKMDVEQAEWDSLLATPVEVLDRFAQFTIEFHGTDEVRFLVTVQKLKEVFYVAHVHYNNYACSGGAPPFPADVYEVLFVHKRLADVDRSAPPTLRHPLDAPNNPDGPDCQAQLFHLPAGMLRSESPASLALAR